MHVHGRSYPALHAQYVHHVSWSRSPHFCFCFFLPFAKNTKTKKHRRHTVTGQFTYQLLQGGHVVSPDTVHTVPALGSSAQQPQQQQQQPGAVFQATPSWGHTVVPGSPMPYLIPDGDGEETTHAGVWEMFYDVNGQRYWGNSETGNITYEDPYV